MTEEKEKKAEKTSVDPNWFGFLFFAALAVLSFYNQVYWAAMPWLIGLVATIPYPSYQAWLKKKVAESKVILNVLLYLGLAVIALIIFVWLGGNIFGGFGKFEGQTAEEWFNDYDEAEANYQELHNCVEPYALENGYISADELYYDCF